MKITIVRGLPGAGKSRFTRALEAAGAAVASADALPGRYSEQGIVDKSKDGDAHGYSFRTAIEALIAGRDVVVDNTNITAAEIIPYVALAQAYGAEAEIITVKCDPRVAFERQTHGVPMLIFASMVEKFEAFEAPHYWGHLTWLTQRVAEPE